MNFITDPHEIEKRSFGIISEMLKDRELSESNAPVVKRVIHTTADFDYLENLYFSDGVVEHAIAVIKHGVNIVTDTQMVRAGINKKVLACWNGETHCFIDTPEIAEQAKRQKTTRSAVSMDHAAKTLPSPVIYAIGNAPTALIQLHQLIKNGQCQPELIIAATVGFVNVVESKELILGLDIPCIVARGRKGGSNVAAAIVNALLYEANAEKELDR